MWLVGVDVGGTFTDLVATHRESGETQIHKVATTPDDPARGVLAGLSALCAKRDIQHSDIQRILHGTTTATNAVLEYDGAKTGLITTAGFRDILHIGRHQRPEHYSIMQEVPWQDRPLVRRRHRLTVPERLAPPDGQIVLPLDETAVREAARNLRNAGIEAVAIGFLFSYLNPIHEQRAKAIVLEEIPGCFVTTSAEVSPQFREFERFTTTAMNAFLGPRVGRYLQDLERSLAAAGFTADLHIMCSNGGVSTAAMVAEKPVSTILSGPAAGILGGQTAARSSERQDLITFDVGGTSADIGIVVGGAYGEASARDTAIGGYPVMVPMIDIKTIGAGGGSLAERDAGGGFRVGPRSAGARPGPAAYGFGCAQATVTDAHVLLGRLQANSFLGGAMTLDRAAAEQVLTALANDLGLSPQTTAQGILTLANANMANAIRSRTVEKGLDPRDFTLVAFGGAGPLHAVEVARILEIPEVLVPAYPGITCAVGLLTTDLKYDAVKTSLQATPNIDCARITQDFHLLTTDLERTLTRESGPSAGTRYTRSGDLRYAGQGYELRIFFPDGAFDATGLTQVLRHFEDRHRAEFGQIFPESEIEIVNLRVTAVADSPKITLAGTKGADTLEQAYLGESPVCFDLEGADAVMTPLYRRHELPVGTCLAGPAILLQTDTTTVLPPGATANVQANGNLLIASGAAL